MIDYPRLREAIEQKTGLARFNGSHSNIISYCPWCEKKSTKNHGHLYIECNNSNVMPMFHCFKCEDQNPSKGTLLKLLKQLGISPQDFIPDEILKSKSLRTSEYYQHNINKNNLIVEPQNVDRYKAKKQYLHARLGIDYDINRIPGLILNIREFIRKNNIELREREIYLEYYEQSFIGFVSSLGTVLILRNIETDSYFRYIKIPLTTNQLFFKDIYVTKQTKVNDKNNTIILCEGIFDLLVSMNHEELQELKDKSCLCAAIFGCGYHRAILTALDMCKLTAANFIILSDIDKKQGFYYKLKQDPSVLNMEIYWNKFGKDFGALPIQLSKSIF